MGNTNRFIVCNKIFRFSSKTMDLALHFPCSYPLIKQGFRRLNHLPVRDAPSPPFGQSLSRTSINGYGRICLQEKASSFYSMGRSKKGSICCKKLSERQSSNPSKSNQEEIISLLKRIQSSISKGESPEGVEEKKNKSSEHNPLTKAILDVLEKPREKTEGDKGPNKEPSSRTRPSASSPRGMLPLSKSDKALEETTEKEEKPPLIETMKLAELKEVAKSRGIKGYSKLKKSEILELLKSS